MKRMTHSQREREREREERERKRQDVRFGDHFSEQSSNLAWPLKYLCEILLLHLQAYSG